VIRFIVWHPCVDPRLVRGHSFKPKPPHSESPSKLAKIENAQTTKGFGSIDLGPIDLALPPIDGYLTCPEHSTTDLGEWGGPP
jgi:hypothetical protein